MNSYNYLSIHRRFAERNVLSLLTCDYFKPKSRTNLRITYIENNSRLAKAGEAAAKDEEKRYNARVHVPRSLVFCAVKVDLRPNILLWWSHTHTVNGRAEAERKKNNKFQFA